MLKLANTDSIRQEIGESIAIVIADLGIKTIPDKFAQKRIIYYLLTYYRDFSIDEIKLAFELALVGRITVDIEHYHSFDIKYLSRILNAFRKYRNEQNRILIANQPKKVKVITEKEKKVSQIRYFQNLERAYETYQKTGILNIFIHWIAYNQLLEIGILIVDDNDWINFISQAENAYKKQLLQSNKREDKEILYHFDTVKNTYPNELSRIRNIAKKLAIQDFFRKLKQANENLNELFKNLGIYG